MSAGGFAESVVEQATLAWLEANGYAVAHGAEIAPGEAKAERGDYHEVILARRLHDALERLNPDLPPDLLEEAYCKLTRTESPSPVQNNRAFHRMLTEGVTVEQRREDGSIAGVQVRLLDFEEPDNNDWLAVNQFTVVEGQHERRADVVIFVNGLPLATIELKNPADEQATIWSAFNQLQTYKNEIPSLFRFNELLIVSDGVEARVGSLTSDRERFMPWRTIDGKSLAPATVPQLQVVIEGIFDTRRFLTLIRNFVAFEDEGSGKISKKIAGYHQFHAVNKAIEATIEASRATGDRRGTDGSRRFS